MRFGARNTEACVGRAPYWQFRNSCPNVRLQVRLGRGGPDPAEYCFSYRNGKGNHEADAVLSWLSARRMGEWRCSSSIPNLLTKWSGEWSASRPCRFTPGYRSLGGSQSRSGRCRQERHLPWQESNPWLFKRHLTVSATYKRLRTKKKQTPWSESASELYRPSYRRLSAKWLPTFAYKGATLSAWRIPRPYSRVSRQEPLLFYQVAPQLYSRGWVDPVSDPLLLFW
jgi:hypothetical protein